MLRIIIIDDETDLFPLFKIKFKREIKTEKVRFNFFNSGLTALEFLRDNPELKIDHIFTDINFPDYSGLSFYEEVKKLKNDYSIHFISSENEIIGAKWALGECATNFFTKPIDFNILRKFIF